MTHCLFFSFLKRWSCLAQSPRENKMRGERDVSFFWVVPHRYPCVSLPTSSPLGSEVRQRVHLPITSISASLLWTLALCGLFTSRVLTVVQKLSLAGEVRRGNMNWYRYRERKKKQKRRMMRCLWAMESLSNRAAGNKQQSL